MSSMGEIIEKKKQIIKEVLNYSYDNRFVNSIKNFDYKNKKHLILLLRNYRDNVIIENDEKKRIINHMIANEKNILNNKYHKWNDLNLRYILTLEELIEEGYKRLEITKKYIKTVVEKLKHEK